VRVSELAFREGGFGPEAVDYLAAWETQRELHASVVAGTSPDTIWLLEHPPVFTAGKRTAPGDRPADPGGARVIDVDRGGMITFHGPGQLVGYPIVRLPDHVKVVDYVRRVEEALIAVCADFGVETARIPGRSGVWLKADQPGAGSGGSTGGGAPRVGSGSRGSTGGGAPRVERKVAALGIRVSQGVTMHGFALNCDVDLAWYDRFVPCGIADAGVTSLSAELGRDVTVYDVLPSVRRHLSDLLAWTAYTMTPDYEPRPEPGREVRVPVLGLPG
jgi:lipoyl(octanoyl) transferase